MFMYVAILFAHSQGKPQSMTKRLVENWEKKKKSFLIFLGKIVHCNHLFLRWVSVFHLFFKYKLTLIRDGIGDIALVCEVKVISRCKSADRYDNREDNRQVVHHKLELIFDFPVITYYPCNQVSKYALVVLLPAFLIFLEDSLGLRWHFTFFDNFIWFHLRLGFLLWLLLFSSVLAGQ